MVSRPVAHTTNLPRPLFSRIRLTATGRNYGEVWNPLWRVAQETSEEVSLPQSFREAVQEHRLMIFDYRMEITQHARYGLCS